MTSAGIPVPPHRPGVRLSAAGNSASQSAMSSGPTVYDSVAYPSFAYLDTHPRQLATLASFYGMAPAAVDRCRVLELGCGSGANLIPMAYPYPDSEFVGIDLSSHSIERGASEVRALGLNNISLRTVDIAEMPADYGKFDYIIAHGVYSWVPAAVREKLLEIYRRHLAPQGVGFVSYNAYPDGHLRNVARAAMLFHVRGIEDPQQRVEQARAILKTLAEASDETTVHGAVMRQQLARVESMRSDTLFHDDLNEIATPFLLHQVVADAERHGLQYLCDAAMWRRWFNRLPEHMKGLMDEYGSAVYIARDQYLDFIDGTGFRQTLLCHRDVRLNRKVEPDQIKRCHLASPVAPKAPGIDPLAAGIVEFESPVGSLKTDHRLTKAALLELGAIWPAALGFADLLERALRRIGARADAQDAASDEHIEAMTSALFRMVCSGHVDFYAFPPAFVTKVGERPEASLLARQQARTGTMVTSLRHDMVSLKNEILRHFLVLVDGTRSVDELAADLQSVVTQSGIDLGGEAVTRQTVEQNLQRLAALALLVR